MLGRMRLIVDRNEAFLAESLNRRNVDGHLAKRGREGRNRGCSKPREWDEMRGAYENRALNPAAGTHADERRCCDLTRVGVTGMRRNDAAALRALLHRGGREKIVDGSP